MDSISAAIVNASIAQSQSTTAQQVSIAVLKKAMDIEASTALALVQSLPQVSGGSALGSLVDVYA